MIDDLFKRFDGAFSENTIRAYRADFMHYQAWCQCNGLTPFPTTGEQLASYIDAMAGQFAVATLQRRVASLGSLLRLLELEDPTKGSDCAIALKRAQRKYGAPQQQATPLTAELMRALQQTCDSSLIGQRDFLLLQLGHETLRRRSEIVRFRFEDLVTTPAGTHRLLLRQSKTDPFKHGKQLPVSRRLVELIRRWQDRLKAESGFIFPHITKTQQIQLDQPIHDRQVNRILQSRQRQAGIRLEQPLSGHSFRVGGALELLKRGVPMEKIMLRGGWQSEASALRYLRKWIDDELLVWDED